MPIISRDALLQSLADTIADYRQGEIHPITPTHVERWLNQFEADDQLTVLTEMDSLMKRFYFSRIRVKECLRNFLKNDLLDGYSPTSLLARLHFLQIQRDGNSQRNMLELVDEILIEDYGLSLAICGTLEPDLYVYIDDGIYTGNKLRYDLTPGVNASAWLVNGAPQSCTLIIYTVATHLRGMNYAAQYIRNTAREKRIVVKWKNFVLIDNYRSVSGKIEFLWPEFFAGDSYVDTYVSNLRIMLAQAGLSDTTLFRQKGTPNREQIFSSLEARKTVENAFLKSGIRMIAVNQNSGERESLRPLGFEKLKSLGLGTFFITYQNIANNCPLALWGSGKWYPLFPRRTNSQYNEY